MAFITMWRRDSWSCVLVVSGSRDYKLRALADQQVLREHQLTSADRAVALAAAWLDELPTLQVEAVLAAAR